MPPSEGECKPKTPPKVTRTRANVSSLGCQERRYEEARTHLRRGREVGTPCEKASVCTSRRPRNCCRRASENQRRCHENATAKSRRCRNGARTRGKRRHEYNALRQSWRKLDAPSHVDRTEGRLATWDPAGRPPGEEIIGSKGPVKANKNDAAGIGARKQNRENLVVQKPNSVTRHRLQEQPRICTHHRDGPMPQSRSPPDFRCDAHIEGGGSQSSWETQRPGQRRFTRHYL